ncbi:unnamed protein product [Spirodela intermedia]|uniref:Uncharacterized protein n=1 Tax=Spirodela intermedia TaxID=51605 RepID=A0A7I8J6L0_SPIIN|nr:unnamed protein product [Spirodela intermedia]CAA6665878.1 unnamed protein product [Spirodela intermedia]
MWIQEPPSGNSRETTRKSSAALPSNRVWTCHCECIVSFLFDQQLPQRFDNGFLVSQFVGVASFWSFFST